ncbi:MAG: aminodeoxychorismate synthase component I [Acidobacteriota bacterium]|nr:aminodeoxychorismate synthase component I [Acidobacteriota bacterium]MDH3522419.1 aminodeoxychorismate synthase component I [Acidobacteriota bacterium]
MSKPKTPLASPPLALLRHPRGEGWRAFPAAREILTAASVDAVGGVLARAEQAADDGLWAVGFLCYEAAAAFDGALTAHPPGPLPPAWFALCDPPLAVTTGQLPPGGAFEVGTLEPAITAAEHALAVRRVRGWIARGDTYQVNYTYPLRGAFAGDPWGLFRRLWRDQRAPHAAWIDAGGHALCSVSPELFFELADGRVRSRPMKGTAARGRTTAEDRRRAAALAASPKDRAENVMIVDMIRNDLGRIATPGSVETTRLFEVERYETLFQLTSTVSARTTAGAAGVLAALFPCASITGAPKVRAMELIAELEPEARGVYTGAIGCIAPRRRARFSVAIRTAVVDRARGALSYGTGGGIVWDSEPRDELAESAAKARVLTAPAPPFSLLETILWEPAAGYRLLPEHLDRLVDSACYFDVPVDRKAILGLLERQAPAAGKARRVRLLVARDGTATVRAEPLTVLPRPCRLELAAGPVDSADAFLFHKTTHRAAYERARRGRPEADEVLLWNERGELTEGTWSNLVLDLDGRRLTPALDCGLLAGTLRRRLLERGEIEERVLRVADLARCEGVWLINSVRGWTPAVLATWTPDETAARSPAY